ncbi:histidine--tRNA ligase [Candidatus Phytoplasma solani]|uniref:Histidine--tRNA ligase n=2 Tax=Candidatus Phytoplasma solani TaxID=69896 RepID=A0A421NUJ9_9MOLU|nr:histidine--tRNA ligase [Candidatus Phytoplasma solani]RMI87706.1 histidyl-tRNA synthetase [Candidatus Phytoplasma solani]CCP88323.1 Histidyl-tRNA synthetase [Candidatus Phytoplasma solani]CCP88905.1 Histidyl-tRNA synthetase [Candidatus Phytoplasma solani]
MFYKIKGTCDLLPEQTLLWHQVETVLHAFFKRHNFGEIRTPIMEYTEVFHRAAQHSEMVSKETYTFLDKKKRSLTLRPEGTAGIIRSYVENKLDQSPKMHKFYYYGPYFRYERPQSGRYRQFHQLGVEILGKSSPFLDVEVITLAYRFLETIGIDDAVVKINSLGNNTDYQTYLQVFKIYLQPYFDQLCPLCQERFQNNILRIWDCKICSQKAFLQQAPKIFDSLSLESQKRFQQVLDGLQAMNVNFVINHDLVRGLDYYTHTVFEITTQNAFNHRGVLGGGGCYDHLVATFDGTNTSGIGFAFGMERLMLTLEERQKPLIPKTPLLDLFLLSTQPSFFYHSLAVVHHLRQQGITVDLNYDFLPFTKALKQALKTQPNYLLILGDQEFAKEQITIKNTQTKKQTTIAQKDILFYLQNQGVNINFDAK